MFDSTSVQRNNVKYLFNSPVKKNHKNTGIKTVPAKTYNNLSIITSMQATVCLRLTARYETKKIEIFFRSDFTLFYKHDIIEVDGFSRIEDLERYIVYIANTRISRNQFILEISPLIGRYCYYFLIAPV